MIIKLRIDNDILSVNDPNAIVSGSKNYYRLQAAFTSDWNGLSKYVVFPAEECSVAMSEDSAIVPEAIVAESGILTFGLIGIDGDGNLRIATNYTRLRILEGTREIHALPPSPSDDATWESYIGKVAQQYLDELRDAGSGFVKGPSSAVAGRVAVYDGATGKLIKDGGVLLSALAKLASPTFTGAPKAPTASEGVNTTQLATTAFVETATHMGSASEVMVETIGGLPAGTDIKGMDVKDLLKGLLIKYVPPAVSLTATSGGGGVYELGSSVTPVFSVTVTRKSKNITSLGLYNGSAPLASNLAVQAAGGTQTGIRPSSPLTADAVITASAGDGQGTGASAAVRYTFVNPIYYGAAASAPSSAGAVKALTKLVAAKGSLTLTFTAKAGAGRFCLAYPSSYGALKTVFDGNGFDNTADFTRSSVTVPNAAGTNVSYYVYTYNNAVTPGTMKMTFNF